MSSREENILKALRRLRKSDSIGKDYFDELVRPAGLEAAGTGPSVTPEAVDSWNRFDQGLPLSPTDLYHLESIIKPALRPAFDIESDSFENLPSAWKDLNDQRTALEPLARGIGRLDLTGHPSVTFVGTAFVCSDSCLITNRHVAQVFTQSLGNSAQISFSPGVSAALNLKEEVGSTNKIILEVVAPVMILEEWDIAIFQVGKLPDKVQPLPLAGSSSLNMQDAVATIIGYPAFDPAESLAEQTQIFRGVFNKKRLQPGKLQGILPAESFGRKVQSLGHDCSTLGGNSGSALIDVATARVVGVHFAGQTHVANYAVPTWELSRDQRVKACNLNFVN
jgi:endonuclease G, mitochondrial